MTTLTAPAPVRTPAAAVRPGRVGCWVTAVRTGDAPRGVAPADLDAATRWLLATRAALVPLTALAALGAALLALRAPGFRVAPLAVAVVGLLLAHLLGALLRRLSDPDHRLVDLVGRRRVGLAVLLLTAACLVAVAVLALQRGWPVLALAAAGALVTVARARPARWSRAGAALAAGPLVVAGGYLAATGALPWQVWLAGLPFGLLWAGVVVAPPPRRAGARARPGDASGGRAPVVVLLVGCYAATGLAVAVEALPWPALLVVLALPALRRAAAEVRAPAARRPKRRAPLWVAPVTFGHAHAFTALLVLGLVVAVSTSTGVPPAGGGP